MGVPRKPCARKTSGRPPAGLNGEAVSKYPQLSTRIPAETKARLSTIAFVQARPEWRVLTDAVIAYAKRFGL